MTRERLDRLTDENLNEIAVNEGILSDSMDRDQLIEVIIEVMEEEAQERDFRNNPAMHIKTKKYDILQNEELHSQIEQEFPLPDSYNENRIVLLLRDPHWAFTYWDIKPVDIKKFSDDPLFDEIFLRVFHAQRDDEKIHDYFDIPVQLSDQSWYINLPVLYAQYRIQLTYRRDEVEMVLCESNVINTPKGDVTDDPQSNVHNDNVNVLLILSGLSEFTDSEYRKKIPQRIISLAESNYISVKK